MCCFYALYQALEDFLWLIRAMVTKKFFANATRTAQTAPFALFLSLVPLTLTAADPFDSDFGANSAATSTAARNSSNTLSAQWQYFIAQEFQRAVGVEPTLYLEADGYAGSIASSIRSALQREISTALKLSSSSALKIELRDGGPGLYDMPGLGLVRQVGGFAAGNQISPTLISKFGNGEVHIGGVFTYENFSSAGFGSTQHNSGLGSESSAGSALILGWNGALTNRIEGFASLQTVTRMDEYRSYRGLFAQAGRFDQPARVRAGVNYAVMPDSKMAFSVERVDYSAVQPFASRLLPDRFVSLLGDSASPTFAWQDLTIYRVGYDQRIGERSLFSLAVSSSLQPSPTDARLRRALAPGSTDYTVSLGFERSFSNSSRLRLGASYMPFSYFFGPSLLSAARDYSGARMEAEALFEVLF